MPIEDHFQSLRALQEEAADLARRFAVAATAGGDTFTGTDDTGSVEVTVAADGRLMRMRLDQNWRREFNDAGLGAAVVAALTSAMNERLTAWAASFARDTGPQPASGGGVLSRAEPGDPTSRQSAYALRDLLDLLDEVDEQMPTAIEAAGAAATRSVTAANSGRTVRVTATAGAVTSVDVDGEWLRSARHDRIADAITEAVTAVQQLAADERDKAFGSGSAFARLRRLTASPETLWRETGLIR